MGIYFLKVRFGLLCLLFIVDAVTATISFGQADSNPLDNVVPNSPTVAELSKYGNIPVDMHSGIPDISIPLYQIESGSLSVPISLQYHAGGFKVGEAGSNVGLGWSLNAGGVVSCIIRGASGVSKNNYQRYFLKNNTVNPITTSELILSANGEGAYDFEPDLYTYNITGATGKFFFDLEDRIHLMPKQNIEIKRNQPDSRGLVTWEIRDAKGTIYYFGEGDAYEEVQSDGDVALPPQNAFYLTTIISAGGGDTIRFEYEDYVHTISSIKSGETVYSTPSTMGDAGTPQGDRQDDARCDMVGGIEHHFSPRSIIKGKRLKAIRFDLGWVSFIGGGYRRDLQNSTERVLDSVKVFDRNGGLVRQFHLVRNFNDGSGGRLLRSVEEISTSTPRKVLTHSFEYDENSLPMPEELSYSMDYFGYYNGKLNFSFAPKMWIQMGIRNFEQLGTADRNVDPSKTQAYMLKKITYPTGGHISFEYENNTSRGGPHAESIFNQHKFGSFGELQTDGHYSVRKTNSIDTTFTINISNNSLADIRLAASGSDDCMDPWFASVEINNITTGELVYSSMASEESGKVSNILEVEFKKGIYSVHFIFEIVPSCTNNPNNGNSGFGSLGFSYKTDLRQIDLPENYLAGGLRVKSVRRFDGYRESSTYYYYNQVDTTTSDFRLLESSSGISYYKTRFRGSIIFSRMLRLGPPEGEQICWYSTISGLNQSNGGLTQGNPVGYEYVTVVEENEKETGKSVYYYSLSEQLSGGAANPSLTGYGWRSGQLLKVWSFKMEEGLPVMKNRTVNIFETDTNKVVVMGGRVARRRISESFIQNNTFVENVYENVSEWMYLSQSYTTEYDDGRTAHTTKSIYRYDPVYLINTQTTTRNSEGEMITTRYVYPFHKNDPISLEMVSRHMIDFTLETIVEKDGKVLSASKTAYGRFGLKNSILPQSIYRFESTIPIDRGVFEQHYVLKGTMGYDGFENPVFFQSVIGVPTLLLWGYNGRLPIAKVTGALPGQAYYNGFEEEGVSAPAKTGRRIFPGVYTIHPEKQIQTVGDYTVCWWEKDGNAGNWEYRSLSVKNGIPPYNFGSSNSSIDELRIYPTNGQMATFSHNLLLGPNDITDINMKTAHFEYDGFNRLKCTRDDQGNIVQLNEYYYQIK